MSSPAIFVHGPRRPKLGHRRSIHGRRPARRHDNNESSVARSPAGARSRLTPARRSPSRPRSALAQAAAHLRPDADPIQAAACRCHGPFRPPIWLYLSLSFRRHRRLISEPAGNKHEKTQHRDRVFGPSDSAPLWQFRAGTQQVAAFSLVVVPRAGIESSQVSATPCVAFGLRLPA